MTIQNVTGLLVPNAKLCVRGKYEGEIVRAGKIIDKWEADNVVVNEGLNSLLSIMLAGGSQLTTWYLGIFSGNYTPVATDAAATIAASSTEFSGYSGGARQTWVPGSVASQSVSNSASRATFTITAAGPTSIYGAFMISNSTISGTSGTMFSGAQFGSAKSVVSGDQLLLTYTFTAASA